MSKGIVVSVATDSWVKGQNRLKQALSYMDENIYSWSNTLPPGCPPHRTDGICGGAGPNCVPYAFKAYALQQVAARGHKLLLWADASILPLRNMQPLWERIEEDGYWLCANGWSNDQWTADSAYGPLFDGEECDQDPTPSAKLRELNSKITHVVATTFGLNVDHPRGKAFLDEYYRLASTTKAFCGPWNNTNAPPPPKGFDPRRPAGPCGPATTLGHRHDQTAASVIAWRLGFTLDVPPFTFAYDGQQTPSTIMIARAI